MKNLVINLVIIVFSLVIVATIGWLMKIRCLQELIAVSPILLFVFVMLVLSWWLRDYDFSKALSENCSSSGNQNEPIRSSSRLIAFFSALTAIIIAVSVTSAYLYRVLVVKDTSGLQLGKFAKFVASLGIGVIPYITNKVITGRKN